MAQCLILLSTREFNMVRLNDRHCSGSSIMPQKRNPCSLEVIKAKTSFAHGMMMSLLSVGKALFMGYNRDTQWTKYWIMDLVDESKPCLSIMIDIVRLLQVNPPQMLKLAQEEFLGATPLMEWLVGYGNLPMRKAKMVAERAVKYSEQEGKEKVSLQSLKKALAEMKIHIAVRGEDVNEIQRPDRVTSQDLSFGTPSGKRIKEEIVLLRNKIRANKTWLIGKRRGIERSKALLFKLEKELLN